MLVTTGGGGGVDIYSLCSIPLLSVCMIDRESIFPLGMAFVLPNASIQNLGHLPSQLLLILEI